MQCVSCQFENLPGAQLCGRCGARLDLAAAAIDVHPPRATARAKRWRRWLPWRRIASSVGGGFDSLCGSLGRPALERPDWAVYLRMVVPGWPQFFLKRRAWGFAFLISYLALLPFALVFVGTELGSLLIGLVFCVHFSSIIDIVFTGAADGATRLGHSVVCCAAVALAVYAPATWLAGRFVAPLRFLEDAPPFRPGDVVLYSRSAFYWSPPSLGDVVVYNVPDTRVQVGNRVYLIENRRLDRILAGPGCYVEWNGHDLLVDGRPSEYLPLNPARLPERLTMTVPSSCYLILPSTDPVLPPRVEDDVWRSVSTVPRGNILGRAFVRHQPLRRLWFFR